MDTNNSNMTHKQSKMTRNTSGSSEEKVNHEDFRNEVPEEEDNCSSNSSTEGNCDR